MILLCKLRTGGLRCINSRSFKRVEASTFFRLLEQRNETKTIKTNSNTMAVPPSPCQADDFKVILLGGDGFCGWPTALHLSNQGMEVIIVDNMKRRRIDEELGVSSLTPICDIHTRMKAWKEVSGKDNIKFCHIDVVEEYDKLLLLLLDEKPTTIVDFAKIKSAPYSMKSPKHKKETIYCNLVSCDNIQTAIVESGLDIHLIHLGTMGVYGYQLPTGDSIPEGYIDVKIESKKQTGKLIDWTIPYPPSPGSIYHLTKTQEALSFQFYNKIYGIRITDLHQVIPLILNTNCSSLIWTDMIMQQLAGCCLGIRYRADCLRSQAHQSLRLRL